MNNIIMEKNKKVGDSIFITEIDKDVNIIGKPDFVRNPQTGKLERILFTPRNNIIIGLPKDSPNIH